LEKVPYIINTSKGGVINTADLISALRNEKIKGVALDVLENEQLSTYTQEEKDYFNYLTTQKNVIITPHIAGYSFEASYKLCVVLLEKLGIT
jgi:D-3-phosphoglycerate dehydrogenase